jgi:hypothetical protein
MDSRLRGNDRIEISFVIHASLSVIPAQAGIHLKALQFAINQLTNAQA